MALQRKGQPWKHGVPGVTVAGIASITSYTVRRELSTLVEGKDTEGEYAAVLYGGEKFAFEAEGYCTSENVPTLTGANWSAGGVNGFLISAEVVGDHEGLMKVRVSGTGYANIQ
jgi:hypothetical protein